jgi:membrane protein DedA with SNARE-associated domain
MWWPLALTSCFAGVLIGDFIVYALGYVYGEKVMSLRLTRKFLTRAREAQIKGYFHRHGFKILILGRFAVGFRTAAYLTAGILKLPVMRLFLTDLLAASLSTFLMFGLGYVFAHQIQTSFDHVKHWMTVVVGALLGGLLLYRYYKERQRAGQPVGPPVLVTDDVPLPPDDLHARPADPRPAAPPITEPESATVPDAPGPNSLPPAPPPTVPPMAADTQAPAPEPAIDPASLTPAPAAESTVVPPSEPPAGVATRLEIDAAPSPAHEPRPHQSTRRGL